MGSSRCPAAMAWLARIACVAVCAAWSPASAINHNLAEDFTSQALRDPIASTAEWDTLAGELQIPPFVPVLTGEFDTDNLTLDVVVTGDVAYVSDAFDGLLILDVSNPAAPTLLGSFNTPDFTGALDAWGELVLVADGATGLLLVDASTPASPTLVATVNTPGYAQSVLSSGNHAYVGDSSGGLQIIDLSTPAAATIAGAFDTSGDALGIDVAGELAFVADGPAGLVVIDVSLPSAPTLVATLDTPGYAFDVMVAGDRAYVADGGSGVHVVDVSNPSAPSLISTFDTPGLARTLQLEGDLLYLADVGSGLLVLDVANPAAPVKLTGFDSSGDVWGIDVQGEHVFLAAFDHGVQILRVGAVAPDLLTLGSFTPADEAKGIFVDGRYAYVGADLNGLVILDVSNPLAPTLVGNLDPPSGGVSEGVFASGDLAFLAEGVAGLRIIDVSNPASPTLIATHNTPGSAIGVFVAGDLAYVADGTAGGLQIVDVSDPASPDSVGSLNSAGAATGIWVWGDFAYLADGGPGVQVINVSDPAHPTIVATANTPGTAEEVMVQGGFAYVADTAQGLRVIDVRNPAAATLLGGVDTPGSANGVWVSGETAFIADGAAGVRAINVSNPASPVLGDSLIVAGTARSVFAAGEAVFWGTTGTPRVHIALASERRLVSGANRGQSSELDQAARTIQRVRLVTTQTDSIRWEVSATGGAGWEALLPDGVWRDLGAPGTDLRWRSTHVQSGPRSNPTCTSLTLDWMYDFAVIDSIRDIANDQGRQVRLSWARGTEDEAAAAEPVTSYEIYRRVDPNLPSLAPKVGRAAAPHDALTWPPGEWDFVSSIPAHGEDRYATLAPTLADSTISAGPYRSAFFLRAATAVPAVFFDSEPDSGSSVDNLTPAFPLDFFIVRQILDNELVWGAAEEADFRCYRVYRAETPDFTPDEASLFVQTSEPRLTDTVSHPSRFFYKVSVVDFSGNESEAVAPTTAPNGIGEYSGRLALYQNAPNPFHPATLIAYDVPPGGRDVRLAIYDAQGRLVTTLASGPHTAGRYLLRWDGEDRHGRAMPPGVYFARITSAGETHTRKMTLVR